ncbi:hypothetical protein Q0Z83_000460 [Actinoplanes sichuanensis]|uniref:DUF5994 family protein n=2 Tax=Actinoplanes sichuanensis TaxID=512349 RepID=A0ABW4A1P3_9ACTN|nr:hypothetical protein Q0Z83_000460 [Actinoplanes sichuanensis]
MAIFVRHPEFLSPAERLRARELRQLDHTSFDGSWWPDSPDLDSELPVLLPMLDHVRGPVRQLVLSARDWAVGPDRVVLGLRTVAVDYSPGQSPWTMTVVCVDGGTFTMRVIPPAPSPSTSDGSDAEAWETEGGGLGLPRWRAVR